MSDVETVRDITQLATAVSRLASWAIDTTNEIASLRDEQARHHRAIDALTEQLDGRYNRLPARDELQRRADEIAKGNRAEDINQGLDS